MAFESLLSDKEGSEERVDSEHPRASVQCCASAVNNHSRDQSDHWKVMHKSACRSGHRFSGLDRPAIRCCYETLPASVDEESVFDGRAFWVAVRLSGDNSPMVLCLPCSLASGAG